VNATHRAPYLRNASARRDPPAINGRPPPADLDAEAAVLSSVLLGGALDVVLAIARPSDFFATSHQRILAAAIEVSKAGTPVDLVTVAACLRDQELLQHIGGAAYLAKLANEVPSVLNVGAHARIVAGLAARRRVIAEAQLVAAEGYGEVEPDWTARAPARLAEAAALPSPTEEGTMPIGESLNVAMAKFRRAETGRMTGTPTGFAELDRLTAGLEGGDLTFLAAESSAGKSALAGNIAVNVASRPRVVTTADGGEAVVPLGTLYFTPEMPHDELSTRMACAQGRANAARIRSGKAPPEDWDGLIAGAAYLQSLPIEFDDDAHLTVAKVRARTTRVQAAFAARGVDLALVVVDYLQLMDGRDEVERGSNREREVSEIGKRLRQASRDFPTIHWLILSQLNEDGQLRESRALEQHAPNIWILSRDDKPRDRWSGDVDPAQPARIFIKKQRNGPRRVTAHTWFHPSFCLFSDEERV
jgi:replicative DNA helicase